MEVVDAVNQMSYCSSVLLSMTRSLLAIAALVVAFVVATILPSVVESLDTPPRASHLVPFVIWLGIIQNGVTSLSPNFDCNNDTFLSLVNGVRQAVADVGSVAVGSGAEKRVEEKSDLCCRAFF
ncbi:hypothetical protein C2S52_013826 [Perilla frutescens var. hirtella]|nr:hypothetical protein C2S52_013826 [Perilla frutescens var. hirtella]